MLLQKFPSEEFMATMKFTFTPNLKLENEKAGLAIMGLSYASLSLEKRKDGIYLVHAVCKNAEQGETQTETVIKKITVSTIYFRIKVMKGAKCKFSYCIDGKNFIETDDIFQAAVGKWIGAKMGIFCIRDSQTNDSGYSDFDWFKVDAVILRKG